MKHRLDSLSNVMPFNRECNDLLFMLSIAKDLYSDWLMHSMAPQFNQTGKGQVDMYELSNNIVQDSHPITHRAVGCAVADKFPTQALA